MRQSLNEAGCAAPQLVQVQVIQHLVEQFGEGCSPAYLSTFEALRFKVTYFAGVTKTLATVTLLWVINIRKMFYGYMDIANLFILYIQ